MFLFRQQCLVLSVTGDQRDRFVCAIALSFMERLMGFCYPAAVSAILFPRCRRLHGFGLRRSLQVLFLDTDGFVLAVVDQLKPWGVAFHRQASHALELNSPISVGVGDRIVFEQIKATTR
jgi:uncharacterized membrane protein (UPF0127 family)